jgi:beta-lactam-binding protein with PASTA domain
VVPKLRGKTLKAAGKRARRAGCRVSPVKKLKGVTSTTGRVVKQRPKAGRVHPAGSRVAVTLG